jgi:hypothetical protein
MLTMMTRWRFGGARVWGATLLLALVTGCAAPPPAKEAPLNFSGRGVIALDAATIEVVDAYRPPRVRPHVDHLAPTPPLAAVRRWVAERLRAVGGSGTVQVIIKDASIIETALPRTEGLKGLFTTDQSERYDGRIEVKIVGQSPTLRLSGYAEATATHSITVPEDITLSGREETWNTLVRDMMEDLDERLGPGIRQGLGAMVRR